MGAQRTITIRIDSDLLERVDAEASSRDRSRNVVVCALLDEALAHIAEKEEPREEEPAFDQEAIAQRVAEVVGESVGKIDQDALVQLVAEKVLEGVQASNDALYRDIATQMASSLTPLLAASNQSLYQSLATGYLDEVVARLPEPQSEIEIEDVEPEPEPEHKSWWQRLFG